MSSKTNNRPKSSQGPNSKPNAWSTTTNAWNRPLKTSRPPPGLATPPVVDPINRERFLHIVLSLVGQRVRLVQDDGTVLEGVFHTFTPFQNISNDKKNRYVIKAVQVVECETKNIENGSTVVVSSDKVVSLSCKSMRVSTANGNGFRTDTEISSSQSDKSRELVAAGSAWTAPTNGNSRADALLGDSGSRQSGFSNATSQSLRGQIGEWDQFRANEELFNVQAKFDENLYTTELDKANLDKGKIKAAEKIAREIECTTSANIHIAEERNQVIQGDFDEEDRYSGVLTSKLEARNRDTVAPKMNYAAAAAKASKTPPPGFSGEKQDTVEEAVNLVAVKEAVMTTEKASGDEPDSPGEEEKIIDCVPNSLEGVKTVDPGSSNLEETKDPGTVDVEGKPEEQKEDTSEEAEKKPESKLKKAFTFNPSAKSFTPSFSGQSTVPIEQQEIGDPTTGAPVGVLPHIQGHPHYMHHMVQPGMIPMMSHYPIHYPGGYPGIDQPVPGQPYPPQLMQHPGPQQSQPSETISNGDEQQQNGEVGTVVPQQPLQQPPQQPPPHPGVHVPYPSNGVSYPYPATMGMQRGHSGPHMAGYHPQMVGGHHQIPVVAGRAYQPHMYGMPPGPPQMRPNGGSYYGNAGHYPHYMHGDDEYRGGGRGARGGRGGRRSGRRGGRGGRGTYYQPREPGIVNGGGRHTPQNTPHSDEPRTGDSFPQPGDSEE